MAGVWVESPGDDGSAVWGCSTCQRGAWCSDHTRAAIEARTHARAHGSAVTVETINRQRGPRPNAKRDTRIVRLRGQGHSVRAIAVAVKMSHAGVVKALRRLTADPSPDPSVDPSREGQSA